MANRNQRDSETTCRFLHFHFHFHLHLYLHLSILCEQPTTGLLMETRVLH